MFRLGERPLLEHTTGTTAATGAAGSTEVVSRTAARSPPPTRAGGQDDGSYTNSLKKEQTLRECPQTLKLVFPTGPIRGHSRRVCSFICWSRRFSAGATTLTKTANLSKYTKNVQAGAQAADPLEG